MQKDCQRSSRIRNGRTRTWPASSAAWYQRTFVTRVTGPDAASLLGRVSQLVCRGLRGWLSAAGEIHFPGGGAWRSLPGADRARPSRSACMVDRMPLKGVMLSYTDSASAREVKGAVPRRGLCGDVYPGQQPPGPRITRVGPHFGARSGKYLRGGLGGLCAERDVTLCGRGS